MSAIVTAARCGNRLGEAVLWHPREQALYWIDNADPALFRLDPMDGAVSRLPIAAAAPLGTIVATGRQATLLLAAPGGLALLDVRSGALAPFADPDAGRDGIAYNDGKVDRFGRLWVGSFEAREEEPRGILWCLPPGGAPVLAESGFVVPNGPAFSPDGRTMYFSDSLARRILAFEVGADDPRPHGRRLFAAMQMDEGYPDGLTVDAEGCLWVAHWDGWRVTRFSPAGERLAVVPLPVPRVTSLAFGGADLKTLYVTTAREGLSPVMLAAAPGAGDLFALDVGVRGVAEVAFEVG